MSAYETFPSFRLCTQEIPVIRSEFDVPIDNVLLLFLLTFMRTRGDLLRFAVAFALRGARKLVRGLRNELNEEERFRVADDVVHRLQQHGDPWRLKDDLPPPSRGHST
jgi:hypothetical protein